MNTASKYPSQKAVEAAIAPHEPLLVLGSFDASEALAGPIDEAMEHYILLAKLGRSPADIEKFFRVVLDGDGADWTFVCPPDYKGIRDRQRRIEAFYKDGFAVIPEALRALGYMVGIDIPRRYRRHFRHDGESGSLKSAGL